MDNQTLSDKLIALQKTVSDLGITVGDNYRKLRNSIDDTDAEVGANNFTGNKVEYKNLIIKNQITVGDHDNVAVMSVLDPTYRFWAGKADPATAPFRVSLAGAVTATDLELSTSTSGKRVTISSATNTLTFYDTVGQVIGIGTEASNAIRLDLTSNTNNGMMIVTAVAGNGFYYSNSADIGGRGIYIEQTNNGSNNTQPCVELHHDGHYYAEYIHATHNSGGMIMDITGTGKGIYLISTASGNAMDIEYSGTSACVYLGNGSGKGIDILTGSSGSAPSIYINDGRQNSAISIYKSVSGGNPTGIKIDVTNTSAGQTGYAFEFAGNCVLSAAVTGTQNRKIKVLLPSGAVYYLPLYDA